MNDERELRQLLFEKAGEPTTSTLLPEAVLRRSRLRQLRTVAGGVLASIAMVGLVAVQIGRRDSSTPADRPTATDRTVWVQGVRISAPADWYLIDRWGAPSDTSGPKSDLPVLQLTNWDPGLASTVCGAAIPDDGVALFVSLDRSGDASGSVPVWPTMVDDGTPISDGPCGSGRYVRYRPWDRTVLAWIGIGANADPAETQELFDRFNDVRVNPWPSDTTSFTTPAYILAGEAGSDPETSGWRLEVRPGGRNVELIVDTINGGSMSDFDVPTPERVQWCCTYGDSDTSDPVAGAVAKDVEAVRWIPLGDENAPSDATILSLPPSLGADFDVFFAPNPTRLGGHIVLEGPNETPAPAESEELAWSHEDGAIVARGNDIGTDWELRLPDDDPGTFRFSMGGSPAGTSFGLNLRSWAIVRAPAGSFLVATTTADVDHVDVQPHGGDLIRGRWLPEEVDGTKARYWVLPLPGSGSGEILMGNDLPVAISWPPSTRPGPGQVVISGGEGAISWALHFPESSSNPYCLQLDAIAGAPAGTEASTGCLTPPEAGEVRLTGVIGGVNGALLAAVVPSTGSFQGRTTTGVDIFGQCASAPRPAPAAWEGASACVAVLPGPAGEAVFQFRDDEGRIIGNAGYRVRWTERSMET